MPERIQPRQPAPQSDVQLLASFGGLSSASLNYTGEVIYQDKLINAYVNKAGEIIQRKGTSWKANVTWYNAAANAEVFNFAFDGINYTCIRTGTDFTLMNADANDYYTYVATKYNVLRAASISEPATYTTIVENSCCHVLVATASTQLVSFTLLSRATAITNVAAGGCNASIQNYPTNNTINSINKIAVYVGTANAYIPLTAVGQNAGVLTLAGNFAGQVGGTVAKVHLIYWLRYCDANYYPGLYMYNSALRRNSVPLDVNVQVPVELTQSPIINEPPQDVSKYTLLNFKDNGNPATLFSKVTNQQPTSATQWDFSDGGYQAGTNLYTVRTPAYVAMGAIDGSGNNTRVYMCRLRTVLVGDAAPDVSNLQTFIDRVYKAPNDITYYDPTLATNPTTSGTVGYFACVKSTPGVILSPGVNLSANVELLYNPVSSAGTNASTSVADFTPGLTTVVVDDGYCLPLYGYNAIAKTLLNVYPNVVYSVGNRIVLAGLDNLVSFSDANWFYRGASFTNMQVSTIGFSDTSAFGIRINQGNVSKALAVTASNGVTIVGTNAGIFRISDYNSYGNLKPPTASQALATKISTEVVSSAYAFTVLDSKVYYISNNGFYELQYEQAQDELASNAISAVVSDYFAQYTPVSVAYSRTLRAFVISFANTTQMLAFAFESLTWSSYQLCTTFMPVINQSFDGFSMSTVDANGYNTALILKWSNAATVDFSNYNLATLAAQPQAIVEITEADTNVDALVTPAELVNIATVNVQTQTPAYATASLIQSYGNNTVRALGANSIVISDVALNTAGAQLPIISSFVTKAFFEQKLNSAKRVRGFNLVLAGSGSFTTNVILPTNDYTDRLPTFTTATLNLSQEHSGEGLLNDAYALRTGVGEAVNFRQRVLGNAEGWQLAVLFSGKLRIAGMQFESSSKGNHRTR